MKILLLGEYSGLHNNLKEGLLELGHDVTLASSLDGFKKFPSDILLDSYKKGIVGKIERNILPFLNLHKMIGYDVVQIINPIIFNPRFGINKFLLEFIINNNNIISLLGAGCDAIFWQKTRHMLKYGPFDDTLKFDFKSKTHPHYDSDYMFKWNINLANRVDHIIPIMYEYELGYKNFNNIRSCIPIPLNIKKINFYENIVTGPLKIFHGLNRYGFKGTRLIEQAFNDLSMNSNLDLKILGKMSIDQYLQILQETNVVIDQAFSHSAGMNAIYALGMGKVVLGGAEPESLIALGLDSSPIINIEPSADSICKKIEYLLDNKNIFPQKGYESRLFVEKNHDYIKVANKYVDTWFSKG
ncbi:glycosyltransferase [uncultured Acinetobacter sp.]|uniref:glycosyltransferase n=1 Tax=uncultured Acinetobacter sp. TaxID=165433 RepID=UPI0025860FE7|nr:glycosyltransferase [uncultured Acinetobacter sp.]